MAQTIFYSDLDEFCRKFFVAVPNQPEPHFSVVQHAWIEQEKSLFEHLMLFDKICFKVNGESIVVSVLQRMLGQKCFNLLLDQGAISFVLWDQGVAYLEDNIPNVSALCSFRATDPVHSDPVVSIEHGFKWWRNAPTGPKRKRLIYKLAKLYESQEKI